MVLSAIALRAMIFSCSTGPRRDGVIFCRRFSLVSLIFLIVFGVLIALISRGKGFDLDTLART